MSKREVRDMGLEAGANASEEAIIVIFFQSSFPKERFIYQVIDIDIDVFKR
jgi:hypothetical protein